MKQTDGAWTAQIPVKPEGLMWAIEAIDSDGNGTMWPDFRTDIPYRVVDPWDPMQTKAKTGIPFSSGFAQFAAGYS